MGDNGSRKVPKEVSGHRDAITEHTDAVRLNFPLAFAAFRALGGLPVRQSSQSTRAKRRAKWHRTGAGYPKS